MFKARTAVIKANGKINIGLNILGRDNGFHNLDSVFAEINLFDEIFFRSRKDSEIRLEVRGGSAESIAASDNVVYKVARAFRERYGTTGAEIRLKKNIPVGSGLGGSSADIVGTVRGMAKLFGIDEDLTPFVNEFCSDGEFLLGGGFARVNGRGSVTEKFQPQKKLYFVIAFPDCASVTENVFNEFDRGDYPYAEADIDKIVHCLKSGEDLPGREIFNALFQPAAALHGEIKEVYGAMLSLCPSFISMSGSGSAVYGCFETLELCLWAKQKLQKICDLVIVKETIGGE